MVFDPPRTSEQLRPDRFFAFFAPFVFVESLIVEPVVVLPSIETENPRRLVSTETRLAPCEDPPGETTGSEVLGNVVVVVVVVVVDVKRTSGEIEGGWEVKSFLNDGNTVVVEKPEGNETLHKEIPIDVIEYLNPPQER